MVTHIRSTRIMKRRILDTTVVFSNMTIVSREATSSKQDSTYSHPYSGGVRAPQKSDMVSVHCSYRVIPSESTPTGKFPLSHCDQIKLPTHGSILLVYTPTCTHTATGMFVIDTLRTSLSKALTHYYPLAARLCWIQGGRWELHCNAQGAQLLDANCQVNLDDLGDFVPTQIVEQLLPKVDYGCPIEEIPLLVAQLTRFPCGGLTLGVALCRALVDGLAVASFMNSWAKLARGEKLDPSEMPFLDRTLLNYRKLHMEPRFVHSEFHPPPLWASSLVDPKDEADAAILKLTKDQVQELKRKASDFGSTNAAISPHRPYTSFEVIAGHLWRCVCKARYAGNGNQQTRFSTLVNCRNRLSPPLRNDFFGNATFPTATPTCSFDDLIHKSLSYAVRNIRQAIDTMTDEYVRSSLDYIANQKDLNLLRNTFHSPTVSLEGQFRGNPNLFLVSWMNFPFYGTDFGWGKPVYLGPGPIKSDGKAFLMNNGTGDGFIVAICLQPSHIDVLKKLFYEDTGEVSPTSKL